MDPLAKRLGFHEKMAGLVLCLPAEFQALLQPPPGTSLATNAKGRYGFVVGFIDSPERLVPVAGTVFKHATPTATVWLAHKCVDVQVAATFQSPGFADVLEKHRRKKRSQIRIGRSEREAEWIAIRFVHF